MSLPAISNIDTSLLSEEEQWDMAVSLWTTLCDAWATEAVQRGISVTSPTPNIGIANTLSAIINNNLLHCAQILINQGLTNGSQA